MIMNVTKSTSLNIEKKIWEEAKKQALMMRCSLQNLVATALLDYLNAKEGSQWRAYQKLGEYRAKIIKSHRDSNVPASKTSLYFDEELKIKLEEHCKVTQLPLGGIVAASLLRFSKVSSKYQNDAYKRLSDFRKGLPH